MTTGLKILVVAALLVAPLFLIATPAEAYSSRSGAFQSFDGTFIAFTIFEPAGTSAASPVPIVLRTHGWGGVRETVPSSTTQALLDAGYAVATWDSRGFGQSGGQTQLNSPDYEVMDAKAFLDRIQRLPTIAKDADGVVAAMSGVSYAGGIQLLTSAFDPRIRAIAPEITWNDLRYSLAPNGVVKNQWIQLLFWVGAETTAVDGIKSPGSAGPQTGGYDTNLPSYYAQTMANNGATQETLDALAYRSAISYETMLQAPSLFIQGWPDSLFVPNEAIANYEATLANGAPAKLLLYCGGHAGCPYTSTGQRDYLDAAIVTWFDAHVKGLAVDTGPAVEYFTSDGTLKNATAWPIPGTTMVTAENYANIVATPIPTSGGVAPQANTIKPGQDGSDRSRFRLPIPLADGAEITGVPHIVIELTSGTASTTRDATLFARLVDVTAGTVLDGQTTPIRFSGNNVVSVDMVGVSYVVPAGNKIALEITTSDAAYSASRFPGLLAMHVVVDVPVVS